MKTRIRFFSILLIFFIVQDATSQQITYSGPVQYKSIRTTKASGGGSDKGYNWDVNVDEKFMIEGTFYVTFTGGVSPVGVAMYQMTSIEEDIHIENTVNNELYDEKISQYCYDNLMRYKRTETPGDSRTKKLAVKSERLDPDKPCIFSGNLTIISPPSNNKKEPTSGKYSIMLMGEIKTDVTYMSYEEMKFPCDSINPTPPPSSFTKTNKINFPIAIIIEKEFDGSNILEGRKVINDNHSTDSKDCVGLAGRMAHGDVNCAINENITVSWTLSKWCEALNLVGEELDKKDINESTKKRINEVLKKLENPNVDSNVFLGWYTISTVKTKEQGQKVISNKKDFMDDLREILNKDCERSKDLDELVKNVIEADRNVVKIINKFNLLYLQEHILSPGQVVIKDWIADQQQNPNSIYSCYDGK